MSKGAPADAVTRSGESPLIVHIDAPAKDFLDRVSASSGLRSAELLVVAPHVESASVLPEPGALLLLGWTTERGIYTCRAVLVSVAPPPASGWCVRVAGAIEKVQRREYARAELVGAVAVVPHSGGPVRVVKGHLTDLSEGGLRAGLDGPLVPGSAVEVHMELDSIPVALPGHVLRSTASAGAYPVFETVVTLALDEAHAAALRRVVLRQQLLARRREESR